MFKFIKRDEIPIRATVDTQHLDLSCHLPVMADTRDAFDQYQIVYLEGDISPALKLKWPRLIIEIVANEHMAKSKKLQESMGEVEGLSGALFVRCHWPTENFGALVTLIANNRIASVTLEISPIRYRSASLHSLSISTRTEQMAEAHFNLVNGPRRQSKALSTVG